ncbi:TetR/AcrR family transcriptional regulator [Streptomyces sp. NPDC019443]|uniref:TetR/AcrR family transcriptional regulator n=1 Tax=Streptomyces sp. NPDC019443 TaxID=3365061 RepID=UPI0037B099EC
MPETPPPSAPAKTRRTRLSAADRRASIVAAATEVFAESGYQRGKVSQVAARIGVTEPVVFHNFGSKATLYAAVVEHAAQRMGEMLTAVTASGGPARKTLTQLLGPGHLDELHASGSLGVIFADAMTLTAEPDVEQAVSRGMQQLADALAELVAQGQREGDVRTDIAPDAAAWWLLSLMASHRFRSTVMPDRELLEAQLGSLTLRLLTEPDA